MTENKQGRQMYKCRLCREPLEKEGSICTHCGYDPSTDTVNQDLKQKIESGEITSKKTDKEKQELRSAGGVDPRIKKFAFIGVAIVIFSIFYKYNFNISHVASEFKYMFTMIRTGKFAALKSGKKKDIKLDKIELINVRSYQQPKKTIKYKGLTIEGIFFDPPESFVVINGEVIREGATSGKITVNKINKDSVEVFVDGETKILQAQ